jgi:hypothetical protein
VSRRSGEVQSRRLITSGPYPSVWAMLVMHHHPDNKGVAPKFVNSTQRVYPRTGVDANSRWRVHWDNVAQADMSAGLDSMALKHVVVAVQCEEGSLTIECEFLLALLFEQRHLAFGWRSLQPRL